MKLCEMTLDKMSKKEYSIHVIKKVVVDGFILCGLTVCIYAIKLWQPFNRGFFCNDESLLFPYKEDTVTVHMLKGIGMGLPILGMFICEWRILRKESSRYKIFGCQVPIWIQGFYCTVVSFCLGVCFNELATNIGKNIIGRLRPHFFSICRPSINCGSPKWQYRYIQHMDFECTGDRVDKFKDIRMSFPSGHSSWAAYTMIYFALYLESRVTWRGSRSLRHTLQFLVLMLSWMTALSRVSDFKHHWSDVLAGYILGAVIAVLMWTWGTDLIEVKTKSKNQTPVAQQDQQLNNIQ